MNINNYLNSQRHHSFHRLMDEGEEQAVEEAVEGGDQNSNIIMPIAEEAKLFRLSSKGRPAVPPLSLDPPGQSSAAAFGDTPRPAAGLITARDIDIGLSSMGLLPADPQTPVSLYPRSMNRSVNRSARDHGTMVLQFMCYFSAGIFFLIGCLKIRGGHCLGLNPSLSPICCLLSHLSPLAPSLVGGCSPSRRVLQAVSESR